jgi:hypothetical protein
VWPPPAAALLRGDGQAAPPRLTPPLLLMRASSAMIMAAVPVTTAVAARRVSTDVCYVWEGGAGMGRQPAMAESAAYRDRCMLGRLAIVNLAV